MHEVNRIIPLEELISSGNRVLKVRCLGGISGIPLGGVLGITRRTVQRREANQLTLGDVFTTDKLDVNVTGAGVDFTFAFLIGSILGMYAQGKTFEFIGRLAEISRLMNVTGVSREHAGYRLRRYLDGGY